MPQAFSPDGVVTDEDVAYVITECDPNGDGRISRSELMPLAATYKALAAKQTQARMEDEEAAEVEARLAKAARESERRKSRACTVL